MFVPIVLRLEMQRKQARCALSRPKPKGRFCTGTQAEWATRKAELAQKQAEEDGCLAKGPRMVVFSFSSLSVTPIFVQC